MILGEDPFPVDLLGSLFQSYRTGPGAHLLPKVALQFFSSLTGPLPNKTPVVFFFSTQSPPPLIVWLSSLPSLAMYFCNTSSRQHQAWPYTTNDLQGVSAKVSRVLSYKANFWKGKTGTRVGLQECQCAIMHFPEWRVLAKWTATLPLNIGTEFPKIPAQTHGSRCNCVLRGRIILQCLTSSVGTTTVLLVICPYVNLTRTSLSAFLFVACLSLNS